MIGRGETIGDCALVDRSTVGGSDGVGVGVF